MRVKIKSKEYGIEKFVFGKKYFFAFAGCTMADQFIFTRKNMIEMCEIDGVSGRKIASYWISKRKLKEMVNSGIAHFITELQ
jgi:hypothetical protein